ncbi:MAG: hypothetical protein K0U68_16745 [Gammaproteobacteria bacterium]|nr:hypothetical protein [Gammaproteobacteria bacterium]
MTVKIRVVLFLTVVFCIVPGLAFSGATANDGKASLTLEQIQGSWSLKGTTQRKGENLIAENQTWNFQSDGMLKTVAEDRRADDTFSITVKYKIENGMLKVQRAGSNTRWNRFQVLEVSDQKLVLKGGIEGYMYFERL